MFKIIMLYDGEEDAQDELFATEERAAEYADYLCGCSAVGAETLHYSNPGDYPSVEPGDIDYKIIEVDE